MELDERNFALVSALQTQATEPEPFATPPGFLDEARPRMNCCPAFVSFYGTV